MSGRIKGFHFVPDGAATAQRQDAEGRFAEGGCRRDHRARPDGRRLSRSRSDPRRASARSSGRVRRSRSSKPAHRLLKPRIDLIADDQLTGPEREAVQARLEKFLEPPYRQPARAAWSSSRRAKALAGTSRGIAFRLVENLGVLPRDQVAEEVKGLTQDERAALRKFGVRFGAFNIFVPVLLKPAATELRLLLWGSAEGKGRQVRFRQSACRRPARA